MNIEHLQLFRKVKCFHVQRFVNVYEMAKQSEAPHWIPFVNCRWLTWLHKLYFPFFQYMEWLFGMARGEKFVFLSFDQTEESFWMH